MRTHSVLSAGMLLAVLLLVALPGAALGRTKVTKQDRIATRRYLEAKLTYERAAAAGASASKADVEALASRLGGECPGVVAGAPKLEDLVAFGSGPRHPPSPRQRGERARQFRQWLDLHIELSLALYQAQRAPYSEAALRFASTVMSLRWSDTRVTAFEHAEATVRERALRTTPLQVCADLRFWMASGYTSLSAATRAHAREWERVAGPLLLSFLFQQKPHLSRFEDARDRALARQTARLEATREKKEVGSSAIERRLEVELGFAKEERAESQEEEKAASHGRPLKRSVVIGKGRTIAGGAYTIEVERARPGHRRSRARCVSISISESIRYANGGRLSDSEDCVSRAHPEPPTVACEGGLLTVEAQTLPAARRVRLELSDGRRITSPVAIVPPKLGGPIGYYHQALWGPSPIPVSLSELGAHGRVLRIVRLPRRVGCKRPPRPRNRLLAFHIIVSGDVPQGPRFVVVGRRGSIFVGGNGGPVFRRHPPFARGIEIHVFVANFGSGPSEEGNTLEIAEARARHPRPFAFRVATGCQPHEYAILYGLLRDPRDRVLARGPDGLVPLRRAPMPASLHAHGVVSYAALPAVPSEVLVRTPTGRTVLVANLARRAKTAREVCEGEAEPPV